MSELAKNTRTAESTIGIHSCMMVTIPASNVPRDVCERRAAPRPFYGDRGARDRAGFWRRVGPGV